MEEVLSMPTAHLHHLLAQRLEPVPRILSNHFEHAEANPTVRCFGLLYQALVDERCQGIHNSGILSRPADSFCCLQRPSAREYGEVGKEPLLLWREETVAPVDGAAEGLLPMGHVSPSAAQHVQRRTRGGTPTIAEPRQQHVGRKDLAACRCQLDCKGKPVKPAA